MFAITKWSQDQYTKDNVSKTERKEKIHKSLLHPSRNETLPLIKRSYAANSPPKYMTTLIPKTTPPFCHK